MLLTPNGRGNTLSYEVQASVGGKVAQMGQRLIDGVAKALAEDFFKRFDLAMQTRYPQAYAEPAQVGVATPAPTAASGEGPGMGALVFGAIVVLALAAFVFLR